MLLQWSQRLIGQAAHGPSEASAAAKLVEEFAHEQPAGVLSETCVWLESIDTEDPFDPAQRLAAISMLDEAAHASVEQLTLAYVGAIPQAQAGQVQDWRTLSEYLERLSKAYASALDACAANMKPDIEQRLPMYLSRAMRGNTDKMKNGWVRYLPPDRACWESMVRYYRMATTHKLTSTLVKAYPGDFASTCPAYEFAASVMLTAAVPQSLTPRQIDLSCRIALGHAGAFARSTVQEEQSALCMDLDHPTAPALIRAQSPHGENCLFFGPGTISAKLTFLRDSPGRQTATILQQLGTHFSDADKMATLEHALRFWSANPPSRREARTRINTPIQVLIGVTALQRALGHLAEVPDDTLAPQVAKQNILDNWTLTDFSTHGIGARFPRRPDGWLSVGSVIGFRLERSPQWAVAIVRRIRTDRQNQTDVGIEIIAKAAELVALEPADAGPILANVRSGAMLLPENPQLDNRASLLLEPGTYNPAEKFVLHRGTGARRIRLGAMSESLDGRHRVDIEWLDELRSE